MPPRVVSLSPLTWESALSRRPHAVVRVGYGPRGMPHGLVSALDGLAPEGLTFGTLDLGVPAKPAFWVHAFRTGQGAFRRDGGKPPEGYYLFRDGLIIAHHPAGARADAGRIASYLTQKLVNTPHTGGSDDGTRWVYEERVQPGAGWRGGGSGHRDPRQGRPDQDRRRPYEERPRDEGPRHHDGHSRRPRNELKPPEPATPDPYTVIGVQPDASDAEVRKAYKAALKMNHPDRVAHLSPALQAFALAQTQAIREAWEAIVAERGL